MAEEIQITDRQSSYRSVFKATSLFGGVQVYQILIQIVKSKFVAILLGPAGYGIMGLLQSAIDFIKQVTSLGISQSAVRDVSEANGSGDIQKISRRVAALRKVVWWTGLLGLVAVAALSPVLSRMSFGNEDYTVSFIVLSVVLLFDQLCAGQRVVLQGMRRLRELAKCSSIGVTLGLFVSVPLYFLFGVDGIVPTMILNAITSLCVAWIYARKIHLEPIRMTRREAFSESRSMMTMGLAMSLSGVLFMGVAFVLKSYIRRLGGTEDVGLYQAGFVMVNSYVGMIFTAIGTDFYPRLSAVNKDNLKCREIICRQGEVGVLILAPMLTVCMVFMPLVLKILYSDAFLAADEFVVWCCFGMMFKMASWLIAYVFIAKAESKLYIINEVSSNAYSLVFGVLGYKFAGLSGLGMAFAVEFAVYFVQMYLMARHKYKFRFTASFLWPFVVQLMLVAGCMLLALFVGDRIKYLAGGFLILVSAIVSLVGMEKRIHAISSLRNIISSRRHLHN